MRNLVRVTAVAAALTVPTAALAAHHAATDSGSGGRLAQMCNEGSRDITGLPIDQLRKTVAADDAKRAALDDLAAAVTKAAQDIKAACPTEAPPTAPGRVAAMQTRIEAMIAAVATVQPALDKFYGLLSDEQKERFISLTQSQHQGRMGSLLDQDCSAQAGVTAWPTADIERTVHPTDVQRASLTTLQDAATKSAEMAKGSCSTENPLTPTARLAAVGKRLDALLQAVKTVNAPLNDFYAMLDNEQKARFNSISVSQSPQQNEPARSHPPVHYRRHFVSFGYLIRRFFHLF